MTCLRFRYKPAGCVRWRNRYIRRRAALVLPRAAAHIPDAAAGWLATPWEVPAAAAVRVFRIGAYVVGEEGDPQLQGHPGIRY